MKRDNTTHPLIDSLALDIDRLQYYVDMSDLDAELRASEYKKERILYIGEKMREKQTKKTGYPYLYLLACDVLLHAARWRDYTTLETINGILLRIGVSDEKDLVLLDDKISLWHLKSIVYCWAYMYANDKITVSSPRRTNKDATVLLDSVKSSRAFLNMTSDDANVKLLGAQASYTGKKKPKPYLFRLSTTIPGSITLSFMTPSTDEPVHMRINKPEYTMDVLGGGEKNLYRTLLSDVLLANKKIRTVDDIAMAMNKLDFRLSPTSIRSTLSQFYGPEKLVDTITVYEYMEKVFFPNTAPKHIGATTLEEKLGLTPSYKDSYVSSSFTACFHCSSIAVTIREPVNNRIYCTDSCYIKDWRKCH